MGERREDERSSGSTERGEWGELSGNTPAPGKETLTGGWGDEPRATHELEDPSTSLQGTAEYTSEGPASEPPAARRNSGGGAGGGAGTAPAVKPAEIGENVEGWVVYEHTARKGGTLSWRCQNPGNIMVAANNVNNGGMYGDLKRTLGLYRIFATYAEGRQGIFNFIRGWGATGKTLKGLAYLPYGDPGHEQTYLNLWISVTGAKAETKLTELTEAQLDAMATAIQTQEGWVAGTEASRTDPPEPGKPARVFSGTAP
jgi:hypothetical protein